MIPVTTPPVARELAKADFVGLAEFRYQLRRFLRFSEELTQAQGITPLQYQLMLQLKGFPDRDWASVTELAERLQSKHHGVVALISRCEALGLVRRQASASDLRQVEVRLTPQGDSRIEALARLHRDELGSLQELLAFAAVASRRAQGART